MRRAFILLSPARQGVLPMDSAPQSSGQLHSALEVCSTSAVDKIPLECLLKIQPPGDGSPLVIPNPHLLKLTSRGRDLLIGVFSDPLVIPTIREVWELCEAVVLSQPHTGNSWVPGKALVPGPPLPPRF